MLFESGDIIIARFEGVKYKMSKSIDYAQKRLLWIRDQILRFDLICSGTLLKRTKVCGKPNCQCAIDAKARHGPYYEWSRREEQKLVHSVVSVEEARLFEQAIRNHRKIQELLREWKELSSQIIRSGKDLSGGKGGN
jgi:hypothetical protein